MGYVPGEEHIKSVENPKLINQVYQTLKKLGGDVSGSTRFDSHGYLSGFEELPDMEALQVMFPNVEFDVYPPQHQKQMSQPGNLDDQDTFGDITISFRTKGSQGWHNFLQESPEEPLEHDIGFLCWCGITHPD
jgi:hypothetical protein